MYQRCLYIGRNEISIYWREVNLIKGLFVGMIVAIVCFFGVIELHAASYEMHTVNEGDTYYKIAQTYEVEVGSLQSINEQTSDKLKLGSLIKIKPIKDIRVEVNSVNIPFDVQPYIENSRVFVPIRFISEALNSDSIDWKQDTKKAIVKFGAKTIVVNVGSNIAYINGRSVVLDAPVQLYNGRTFVPVRFFSETVGVDSISWNQETYTVSIEKKGLVVNKDNITPTYSQEDLYWLSRLVEAEAAGESFEGKIAVANTVINRKNSTDFPSTIKEIIFDTNFGIQYTPAANGAIYNTPSQESVNAALKALQGYNNVGNSIYFVNPTIATTTWIQDNRTYYTTIENHEFYL